MRSKSILEVDNDVYAYQVMIWIFIKCDLIEREDWYAIWDEKLESDYRNHRRLAST